jgi:hypothetical protein
MRENVNQAPTFPFVRKSSPPTSHLPTVQVVIGRGKIIVVDFGDIFSMNTPDSRTRWEYHDWGGCVAEGTLGYIHERIYIQSQCRDICRFLSTIHRIQAYKYK